MTRCVLLSTALAVVAVLMIVGSVTAQSDEFAMANHFYEQKDFASAIRLYESILDRGVASADLYFNLGNAYFKSGDLGHAVLYYTRARRLAPGDEDIAFNLSFVKQFSRVQMEGVQLNPIHTFMENLVGPYSLSQLGWVTSVFFFLLMVTLTVRVIVGRNSTLLRSIVVVSLILLLVGGGMTTFKYRNDYLTPRAVIIADESPVYTGPSKQSDIELRGAPGLVVEILSESGDFLNVLFENKRRGWIESDRVARI